MVALAQVQGSRDTDQFLSLAVQVGSLGIFESDLEHQQTDFSPELCGILGLPIGTKMSYDMAMRLFDQRDRPAVQARAEAAINSADRGKWSAVCRVTRTDGAVRWVSVHGRRIYRGQKPVRSLGVVIDITDRRETEAALRESERRLRLALEAAQMGTFEADITTGQALIDAQEAHLLGLPEEARVVSIADLRKRIPLEDLKVSDDKKERLTNHHEPYCHDFRLRMPDGSLRWLSAYADVRESRVFGVNFDITRRKRAEAALGESEARLRIATGGAALGVFEWDAETDCAVWENERMYEIFGRARPHGPLTKKEFVESYLHPDDTHRFEAALRAARLTGCNLHETCRITREDRAQGWLQIDGRFQPSPAGKASHLVAVVADITERKLLEQRANELCENLATIQEEERERIAQELHDSTAQHLLAVSLNLMNLRPKAGLGDDEIKRWDDTKASLEEAMKELRTFSYLMHPPALQHNGLCSTIRQYTDGYRGRSGLDVNARLNPGIDNLPYQMQRALLRIAQEALANVHRHAAATRVTLDARCIADRVHLVISDDGQNSKDEECAAFTPGRGVSGMTARVNRYRGELRIRTGRHGTRVHAVLPMDPTDRKRSAERR
jgi:PAS domain S-box-containing protein